MKAVASKNISFVAHSDLGGKSDGVQVMVQRGHAYIGHGVSNVISTLDVRDPRNPKVVDVIDCPPGTRAFHLQAHDDLLITVNAPSVWNMKEFADGTAYFNMSPNEKLKTQLSSFTSGLRVYDISKPQKPVEIGFMPVEGLGPQRLWYVGGRYAYASIHFSEFSDHIFSVVDLIDPTKPRVVGRCWIPGMWTAGGETPTWPKGRRYALHHPPVAGNIAYGAWRDGGLTVIDVADPTNPKMMVHCHTQPPFGPGTHSPLPIPSRDLLVLGDEPTFDNCKEGRRYVWIYDVRDPKKPVAISKFPEPTEADYCAKGGAFGPHNFHEMRPGSFQSSRLIFATYYNAGVRVGGNVPLGYDVIDRKLVVNETEVETVRTIFRRYPELGSVRLLGEGLARQGIVSKRREGVRGVLSGGNRFSRGALYTLLQNRIYRGEITHQGNVYPGQHEAIVDVDLWQIVQDRLAQNRVERSLAVGAEAPSLLAGLIVDAEGHRMTPTHAVKRGKRYRYYVSNTLITGTRSDLSNGRRVPAGDIEGLVCDRLRAFFASEAEISDGLAPIALNASTQRTVLAKSKHLSERWTTLPSVEQRRIVRSVIEQVRIEDDKILLQLKPGAILASLTADAPTAQHRTDPAAALIELSITATLRRAGKGIRLVIGNGTTDGRDDRLVGLLRDAFTTREALLSGRDDSIDAMACRLGVRRLHLASLFRLSYLSPQIVRAILNGEQTADLTAARLMSFAKGLPQDWRVQWQHLGFASA